ncbi:MAG: PAS domain S-box protein [Terriglobales bacterium]
MLLFEVAKQAIFPHIQLWQSHFITIAWASLLTTAAALLVSDRLTSIAEEAEKRFEGLLDAAPDAIVVVNQEGKIVLANAQVERVFGYGREELLGRVVEMLVPQPFQAGHPAHRQKFFADRRSQRMGAGLQLYGLHKDGREIPVEISLNSLETEDGVLISSAIRDITERRKMEEALQQSEAKFRALFESASDAILIMHGEKISDCNPQAETFFRCGREDLVGRSPLDFSPPKQSDGRLSSEKAAELTRDAFRGVPQFFEWEHVRHDGTPFYGEVSLNRVSTPKGGYLHGTVRDITKRRKLEEALQQSEAKFKALFEAANDAILILDGGKFVDCNARAETFFRCGREDLVGHSPLEFSPPKQPDGQLSSEKAAEKIQATLAGLPQFFEWEHVRHDGTIFYAEVSLNRIITPQGEYLQSIARDITGRKQAESNLQEAHAQLSAALRESEQHAREAVQLTELVDILESCQTVEEACKITANTLPVMLSSASGALCITTSSRNMVEAVAAWGDGLTTAKTFAPDDCWALRRGKIHRVNDAASPLRCAHVGGSPGGGYVCVPLAAQGETLGVLCLECPSPSPILSLGSPQDPMEALARQAGAVGDCISMALANLRLREVLRSQSIRDPLTGLFNRRYMEESLEREVHRAVRNHECVTLLMLDIDHFKQFNDTFGHQGGDALLRGFGDFLIQRTRGQDVACRYGGEEFVLILAGATADGGCKRAELLRQELKQLTVEHAGKVLGRISVSIGVSAFPGHGATGEELLHAADQALYRAKTEGRDRVVVSSNALNPSPEISPTPSTP